MKPPAKEIKMPEFLKELANWKLQNWKPGVISFLESLFSIELISAFFLVNQNISIDVIYIYVCVTRVISVLADKPMFKFNLPFKHPEGYETLQNDCT